MRMSTAPGRTEIQQTAADVIAFPLLIVLVLVAIVIRQFIPNDPNPVVLGVCAGLAALDIAFARYLLGRTRVTLVVTADEITFSRASSPLVIERLPTSTLSFRLQSNGFIGGQPQYLLKLRDNASGKEIPAGTFGRRKVRQACESQGWTFA